VAAVAAFMIMRSPSPIQDHRQPATGQPGALTGQTAPTPGAALIDPNAWMNSDGSINSAQQPPTRPKIEPLPPLLGIPENAGDMPFTAGGTLAPATPPTKAAPKTDDDQIASLINTLPGEKTAATKAPPSATAPSRTGPTTAGATAAPKAAAAGTPPAAQTRSSAPRYLQVGSYRDEKEADAFRARMIMMGFNVQIQKARVNNMDVNRVRIGPFDSDKELTESRAQLSGAKINSTIVR
ncbi:MAG TPA: SPOR domain-containing protein, partial [Advenella sp.]|nr:SPOR domain-containing protein [Advenella sp.]